LFGDRRFSSFARFAVKRTGFFAVEIQLGIAQSHFANKELFIVSSLQPIYGFGWRNKAASVVQV
jgi:hypothetical protein